MEFFRKHVLFHCVFPNQAFSHVLRDHFERPTTRDSELPTHWTAMSPKEYFRMEELRTDSPEYKEVEKKFKHDESAEIEKVIIIPKKQMWQL